MHGKYIKFSMHSFEPKKNPNKNCNFCSTARRDMDLSLDISLDIFDFNTKTYV